MLELFGPVVEEYIDSIGGSLMADLKTALDGENWLPSQQCVMCICVYVCMWGVCIWVCAYGCVLFADGSSLANQKMMNDVTSLLMNDVMGGCC